MRSVTRNVIGEMSEIICDLVGVKRYFASIKQININCVSTLCIILNAFNFFKVNNERKNNIFNNYCITLRNIPIFEIYYKFYCHLTCVDVSRLKISLML